ncbi:hypothetical protein [Mycoplasma seminis]|uniref:Uncharacterized protein n=1 Tax=Mycoplasma seminis TaxID=512749 RepID=A0ABY9HBC8_9MOLU|nr:hypothetical protein [Mycoplasma seminis]WLP85913.1 hypothetical protein Q8852_02085 [Mycoplasma seminis]
MKKIKYLILTSATLSGIFVPFSVVACKDNTNELKAQLQQLKIETNLKNGIDKTKVLASSIHIQDIATTGYEPNMYLVEVKGLTPNDANGSLLVHYEIAFYTKPNIKISKDVTLNGFQTANTQVNGTNDFINKSDAELIAKYLGDKKPSLKHELINKKTAFVASKEDFVIPQFNNTDTEKVEITLISVPDSENIMMQLDDYLLKGKIKVNFLISITSKQNPSAVRNLNMEYEIDGYISQEKASEIMQANLNLLKENNFKIDKSKLAIDIDDEKYKGYNEAFKFLNGTYFNNSVAKAITPINPGNDAVKVSFEYNKLEALPDKGILFIQPYLYFDDASQNHFFAYANGKQYADENSVIKFDNLPAKALSANAIASSYKLSDAFHIDKNLLAKGLNKDKSQITVNDLTLEALQQALDINHMLVPSKTNKPEDKFDLTAKFIKDSGIKISNIKSKNEYDGSAVIEFTFNSIKHENANGTIYLIGNKKQTSNFEELQPAKFSIVLNGLKPTKDASEIVYEEKEAFDLTNDDFAKFLDKWEDKEDRFEKKGGALQLYRNNKPPFLGVTGGGGNKKDQNAFLTLKSEITLTDLASTGKSSGYFVAKLDKNNKTVTVFYKLKSQPDKFFKQTIQFK